MSEANLRVSKDEIFKSVKLISMESIPFNVWKAAELLTESIDPKDIPFVATALATGATLITGDKKLIKGLHAKGYTDCITVKDVLLKF